MNNLEFVIQSHQDLKLFKYNLFLSVVVVQACASCLFVWIDCLIWMCRINLAVPCSWEYGMLVDIFGYRGWEYYGSGSIFTNHFEALFVGRLERTEAISTGESKGLGSRIQV